MELLESNNLLAGWSGFELGSTPVQSKKITGLSVLNRVGSEHQMCTLQAIIVGGVRHNKWQIGKGINIRH